MSDSGQQSFSHRQTAIAVESGAREPNRSRLQFSLTQLVGIIVILAISFGYIRAVLLLRVELGFVEWMAVTISVPFATAVVVVFWLFRWPMHRISQLAVQREIEAIELKRHLIRRGLSADEIVRVIESGKDIQA